MSETPSVRSAKYLILKQAHLESLAPLGDGAQIVEGWVTIGHEVRSFQPCLQKKELWIQGDSPALSQIIAAYNNEARLNPKPYVPVFMVLVGKTTLPPADGFGAEYKAAFMATQLVRVMPDGHCSREDLVSNAPVLNEGVDVPMKSQQKITFDVISLDQDGLYGLADGKRALSYEFCIPDREQYTSTVTHIDPTVQCMFESPGRIGCGSHEYLCIGSTHQKNFKKVLRSLAELPYITRINQSFFE